MQEYILIQQLWEAYTETEIAELVFDHGVDKVISVLIEVFTQGDFGQNGAAGNYVIIMKQGTKGRTKR